MTRETLYVDRSPRGEFLRSAEGSPVWPAGSAEELADLARVAELCGARIEEVHAKPGEAKAGREVVVALGEGVEDLARLYAHLTGRQVRSARDLTELAEGVRPAVVVTTEAWFTAELMDVLYAAEHAGPAPGILCARDLEGLRRQVLLRSAAAALSGPLKAGRIDVRPLLPIPRLVTPTKELLGGKASPSELRAALGKGAGLLTLLTHTDGIDGCLGPLTLCPMDRRPADADPDRSPACQMTGMCHRLDLPLEEALHSDSLLAPEGLSARLLVLYGCWGALLNDSVVDAAWGMAPRLQASPDLGAVVTTWKMDLYNPEALEVLARPLSRGVPVGEALGRLLRSATARRIGLRMCLLGDPRVCFPATEPGPRSKRKPTSRPAEATETRGKRADDLGGLAFLRAHLLERLPYLSDELGQSAQAALDEIEAYECAVWRGVPLPAVEEMHGHPMRSAVLDCLCALGSVPALRWMNLARSFRAEPSGERCFGCGQRTEALVMRTRVAGAPARRMLNCPRCGFVEDRSVRAGAIPVAVREGSTVRLQGPLPDANWAARLVLDPPLASLKKCWEWPAGPDGKPAAVFEPPEPWPVGPLRLAFFRMVGGDLSISCARYVVPEAPGKPGRQPLALCAR
jgi:hypothetical protein